MDACLILLRYLTDTSVSPLQKEFVETDDPYASKVTLQMMSLYEDKT
jgi:Zn-dependent M16 (insulinase) family peptidase